ncbi:MAG: hypothetical protein AMJ95_05675 [Omnitrophica WOR_2 bacterium SM23_72]|nr:MAG: hypothetical protein AMJ95_05675 [Omnitrophica WOR_2 bacterium SM23_72]
MIWIIVALFLAFAIAVILIVLKISSQMNERLNQMNQALQAAHQTIGQNLSSFGTVKEQLGKLEATHAQILEISRNLSSFQELLRAPKFRGQMGETLLENLLSQVLPKEHFHTQYRFKSGEAVDAVIRLGERLVSIDAKFSLENFQKKEIHPGRQEPGQ